MTDFLLRMNPGERRLLRSLSRHHKQTQSKVLRLLITQEAERLRQEKKTATPSTAGQPAPVIAEE